MTHVYSMGILDLREDAKGGVQVAGLSEVTARSTDEVSTRDTCIQYGHSGPTGGCQRWRAVAGLSEVTARSTDEVSILLHVIQYGHSGPTGGRQRWRAGGRTVRGHGKVN